MFFIFALVSILILLFISIVFLAARKNHDCFKEKEFYFVFTEKQAKRASLEVQADKIKGLGGAGVIYYYKENYYLISSVYLDKLEAEEVAINVKANFPNSGVLTLTSSKVSKSKRKEIKRNEVTNESFKFFDEKCSDFQNYMIAYMSGTLSQNELSMKLLKDKLKLEENLERFDEKQSESVIFSHTQMLKLYLENFFSKFFESTKKESLVSELSVSTAILYIEMRMQL